MKKGRKALLLAICALMLVSASILGTVAYLTDTETVTNTFTVGAVALSLDEADVDEYGVIDGEDRVQANEYKLIPGRTYVKDPTVHVDPKSESCWLFVKVDNEIASVEAADHTIASQILANGWTALDGADGVYYKSFDKNADPKVLDHVVFTDFTVDGEKTGDDLAALAGKKIHVTAYGIQLDGFEGNPTGAWEAVSK